MPAPPQTGPLQLDLFGNNALQSPARGSGEASASVRIGCAGWQVPAGLKPHGFPEMQGRPNHLQRYAALLPAVEINTSFYRPHLPATYVRWRDSVPNGFHFSVKMPRSLTHEAQLHDTDGNLDRFLDEISHLDDKLGCILVQLPPALVFDPFSAELFFDQLRRRTKIPAVCEPRHSSWFGDPAAAMLAGLDIGFVRADPPPVNRPVPADTGRLGSTSKLCRPVYYRLHGWPVIYRSPYPPTFLDKVAAELATYARQGHRVWCIFDNTAEGHAVPNALALQERMANLLKTPGRRPARLTRER